MEIISPESIPIALGQEEDGRIDRKRARRDPRRACLHAAVIEHPGKSLPLALVFPVLGRLGREQMEKTIVRCRNRAAKIDLFRFVWQIEFRQENSVPNQVVVIGHRSAELGFSSTRAGNPDGEPSR